ncbi:MAG: hypothetical protein AAF629_25180 [Chloroflexota bacterium]
MNLVTETIMILTMLSLTTDQSLNQQLGGQTVRIGKQIDQLVVPKIAHVDASAIRKFLIDPDSHQAPIQAILSQLVEKDVMFNTELTLLIQAYQVASAEHQKNQDRPLAAHDSSMHLAGPGILVAQGSTQSVGGHLISGNGNRVINTGGGAYIQGTGVEINEPTSKAIAQHFLPLYAWIESNPAFSQADKTHLKADAQAVEKAIDSGQADDSFLQRRLQNIERIAPDIIDIILATIANPAAGLGLVGAKLAAKANEIRAARKQTNKAVAPST